MTSKMIAVLTLLAVVVALVSSAELKQWQGSDMFGEGEVDANELEDISERDIHQMALEMKDELEETREEEKRGVFDCARLLAKCHAFKHCCRNTRCNRRNIFSKGYCVPNY